MQSVSSTTPATAEAAQVHKEQQADAPEQQHHLAQDAETTDGGHSASDTEASTASEDLGAGSRRGSLLKSAEGGAGVSLPWLSGSTATAQPAAAKTAAAKTPTKIAGDGAKKAVVEPQKAPAAARSRKAAKTTVPQGAGAGVSAARNALRAQGNFVMATVVSGARAAPPAAVDVPPSAPGFAQPGALPPPPPPGLEPLAGAPAPSKPPLLSTSAAPPAAAAVLSSTPAPCYSVPHMQQSEYHQWSSQGMQASPYNFADADSYAYDHCGFYNECHMYMADYMGAYSSTELPIDEPTSDEYLSDFPSSVLPTDEPMKITMGSAAAEELSETPPPGLDSGFPEYAGVSATVGGEDWTGYASACWESVNLQAVLA